MNNLLSRILQLPQIKLALDGIDKRCDAHAMLFDRLDDRLCVSDGQVSNVVSISCVQDVI